MPYSGSCHNYRQDIPLHTGAFPTPMVDREITAREDRRLKTRLHKAKLRQTACIEDIDYRPPRGVDKALMRSLATCQWVRDRHNVLITGPTALTVPDLDLKNHRIRIRRLKNGVGGEKPLWRHTAKLLRADLRMRRDAGPYLFTGIATMPS